MIYTLANSLVLFSIILSALGTLPPFYFLVTFSLWTFAFVKLAFSQDIHIINILTSLKSLLRFLSLT